MSALEHRYLFKGRLVFDTALHIGGGIDQMNVTDAPIVRTPDGLPYIPGSSFKGAFRSTVEKLAGAMVGITSCCFDVDNDYCLGTSRELQRSFNNDQENRKLSERQLLEKITEQLCDTCHLFGSPYLASKIGFSDLYLVPGESAYTNIRDGVGIDRDSERAVDTIKYDFETVAPGVAFDTEIRLDDPSKKDLFLTCVGIQEYLSGLGGIGGKRSRGLGRCHLADLVLYELDLCDKDRRTENLKKYLLHTKLEEKMKKLDAAPFIEQQISGYLGGKADA